MKKILFFAAAAVLGMGMMSCGNSTQSSSESAVDGAEAQQEQPAEEVQQEVDAHPLEGVYTGLIPAADTDGIKTTLTINAEGDYTLQEEFGGDKGDAVVGGTVQLLGEGTVLELPVMNEESRYFLIAGDTLKMCDKEYNLPQGELAPLYILVKTKGE